MSSGNQSAGLIFQALTEWAREGGSGSLSGAALSSKICSLALALPLPSMGQGQDCLADEAEVSLEERERADGVSAESARESSKEAAERVLGMSIRRAGLILQAPYFKSLMARGPHAVGSAMLGGAREGVARPARFSPLLDLRSEGVGDVVPERRERRREAGERFERELAIERRSPREAGERGPGDSSHRAAPREWSFGIGAVNGGWFWIASAGDSILALSPLGEASLEARGSRKWAELAGVGGEGVVVGASEEAALGEEDSGLERQAQMIKARLTEALGAGAPMPLSVASRRIKSALAPISPMSEGPLLAPLGRPAWVAVWGELLRVPPGRAIGYAELARKAGLGKRSDLARLACQNNPISMLIPCHRAVEDDGGEGVGRWGSEAKASALFVEFLKSRAF